MFPVWRDCSSFTRATGHQKSWNVWTPFTITNFTSIVFTTTHSPLPAVHRLFALLPLLRFMLYTLFKPATDPF